MELCPNCKWELSTVQGEVKTYILLEECDYHRQLRESQASKEEELRPYRYADIHTIKMQMKDVFKGNLGKLGNVYALISGYLDNLNWRGLNEMLYDLLEEGSVDIGIVRTIKAILLGHKIDLDNLPEKI